MPIFNLVVSLSSKSRINQRRESSLFFFHSLENSSKLNSQQAVEFKLKNSDLERSRKELEKMTEDWKNASMQINRLRSEAATAKTKADTSEANLRDSHKRAQGEKDQEIEKLRRNLLNAEKEAEQRIASEMAILRDGTERYTSFYSTFEKEANRI